MIIASSIWILPFKYSQDFKKVLAIKSDRIPSKQQFWSYMRANDLMKVVKNFCSIKVIGSYYIKEVLIAYCGARQWLWCQLLELKISVSLAKQKGWWEFKRPFFSYISFPFNGIQVIIISEKLENQCAQIMRLTP
jgi:hypothetical protein